MMHAPSVPILLLILFFVVVLVCSDTVRKGIQSNTPKSYTSNCSKRKRKRKMKKNEEITKRSLCGHQSVQWVSLDASTLQTFLPLPPPTGLPLSFSFSFSPARPPSPFSRPPSSTDVSALYTVCTCTFRVVLPFISYFRSW